MFVKIDPPGTFCTYEALRDALKITGGETFLEIGCGGGSISKFLCDLGLKGVGVDFSKSAIEIAEKTLESEIASGQYKLVHGDVFDLSEDFTKVDIALSYMVMEHVEDETGFIQKIAKYVRPGGSIILAVPGRKDRWSVEDETVGHLRRYDRGDLQVVMDKSGLTQVEVWSVAVPVANILFHIGAWLVSRSTEMEKVGQSQREQTETSGIREIPWKTVFPSWVRLILNRITLWPLFVIQRCFYRTKLGVTMMGIGRVNG
ncbi:methyltransferase domain-containing protein [Sneathiella chungangensis]|uniref:Methyltransferase domain-containing protein n=1 Tax=Sneathiella chungangensis TaxID=1418234 RepID=A0A845MEF7_9PROT|nr:methyltransferase domain-containing protein [Sneathiella chungangensis]MZR22065.1 methyltransferase domain-containing protein [Sneathiella chungangensis]